MLNPDYSILRLNSSELETAKSLIEAEKHPLELLEFTNIQNYLVENLLPAVHSGSCKISDKKNKVNYNLDYHQTPISTNFSIGLRITKNSMALVRFDFGKTLKHTNNFNEPDSYVVRGNHLHVYSDSDKHTPKNVIPFSTIENLPNIQLIADAFHEFLKYTRIDTSTS